MNAGAAQVFVYYRVRQADAVTAIAAVGALQRRLAASVPGLVCTLNRRLEDGADLTTLMETYAQVEAPTADWQRDIERQAQQLTAAWIVGERHVEVFLPCA